MSREEKKQLRSAILKTRDALQPEEISAAEQKIFDNLRTLDIFNHSNNIFCYLSFRSEVPTEKIIRHCQEQGKNLYIPVCVNETKELVMSQLTSMEDLVIGNYGVKEPSTYSISLADRNTLDIALMPGSAFDLRGYRVGYGAGYYDRFFSHTEASVYKIALAYSFQIVDYVPNDEYDIPVDCIVTEKEIIYIKK